MLNFRFSISQDLKDAGIFTTSGKNSIYHKSGSQLVEKIMGEFEILVKETPQYTGTTAASWEIGFLHDISGEIDTQPPRTASEALSKGSEVAVSRAMHRAKQTLTESDLTKIAREDIVVSNDAPGYDTAEHGPVRPVNTPPGALERFIGRVNAIDFEVDFYKK